MPYARQPDRVDTRQRIPKLDGAAITLKLFEALSSKQDGTDLQANLLSRVKPVAEAHLKRIGNLFPQYTDHTISHSENVLTIMDWLIPNEVLDALNSWELYFLIGAVYLHDVGMLESCPGPPSGESWQAFRDRRVSDIVLREGVGATSEAERTALRDFIRDHHHERSEQYIASHPSELALDVTGTNQEAQFVGRISLGHRVVPLNDNLFQEWGFKHFPIRRRLLASYLRLADELDTTAFRTPVAEYESVTLSDRRSQMEWGKHLAISGVVPLGNVIQITGICDDPHVYLRLSTLHKELKSKLLEVKAALPSPYAAPSIHLQRPIPYDHVQMEPLRAELRRLVRRVRAGVGRGSSASLVGRMHARAGLPSNGETGNPGLQP